MALRLQGMPAEIRGEYVVKETGPKYRVALAKATVDTATRWTSNILVEVLHNHGEYVSPRARELLREVTKLLSQVHGVL